MNACRFAVPYRERPTGTSGDRYDPAQRWFSLFRSGIALRARAEAAPTWHKHGFRRSVAGSAYATLGVEETGLAIGMRRRLWGAIPSW